MFGHVSFLFMKRLINLMGNNLFQGNDKTIRLCAPYVYVLNILAVETEEDIRTTASLLNLSTLFINDFKHLIGC